MSCLIPAGASIKIRKIYNRLVPDVFPPSSPQPFEPIGTSAMRKISKLQEYVQNSPGQIAKVGGNGQKASQSHALIMMYFIQVSRRLARRIIKDINQAESRGYVKIAVAAYCNLLRHSIDEGSSYTYGYFTQELIEPPMSIFPTLLGHSSAYIQALGADLLASFISAQGPVDNQASLLEKYMATITRLVIGEKGTKVKGTQDETLKASCLHAIDEYVLFCIRLKILPAIIEDVEACIFITVDLSSKECRELIQEAAAISGGKTFAKVSILSPRSKPSTDAPDAKTASEAAVSALVHFRPLLQDVGVVFSIVYRILQTLIKFIDGEGKWEESAFVQGLLGLVAYACGDQTLPLFTALMRHGCSQGLSPRQRSVIIQQAAVMGSQYPLSALCLALTELPRALTVSSGAPALTQETLAAVKKLANEVGDASLVCEAAYGALRLLHPSSTLTSSDGQKGSCSDAAQGPQPLTLSTLECIHAALQTIPHLKDPIKRIFPARSFPSSLIQLLGTFLSASPQTSVSSLKAGNVSGGPERSLALKTLLDVVGSAASGSSWIEEGHGFILISIARTLATSSSSGPRELEGASWLTASVSSGIVASSSIASKQVAEAVLELARLAITLREDCLSPASKWSATRRCGGLLLSECLLQQLASSVGSNTILSSPATLKALQEGSQPGLLLVTGGSAAADNATTAPSKNLSVSTLLASSDSFVSGAAAESRANAGLEIARKESSWASSVTSALEANSDLIKCFSGTKISTLILESSRSTRPLADRDCARVDMNKVIELFCGEEGDATVISSITIAI